MSKTLLDTAVTLAAAHMSQADELAAVKTTLIEIQRQRDKYCQALMDIHERATDNFDGDEDSVHGPYLMMAAHGLGFRS